MIRLVKCPICNKLKKIVRIDAKWFYCCYIRHSIDNYLYPNKSVFFNPFLEQKKEIPILMGKKEVGKNEVEIE